MSERPEKRNACMERKYASTRSTVEMKSTENILFCKRFKELKPVEKLAAVEKLGACKRCLVCHGEDDECKETYLCRNRNCKKDHHFFLCLKGDFRRSDSERRQFNVRRHRRTEEQEEFVSKLSPEMADKFKRAFTNITAKTNCVEKIQLGEIVSSAVEELPVILMLLEVTANAGQKNWNPDRLGIGHKLYHPQSCQEIKSSK